MFWPVPAREGKSSSAVAGTALSGCGCNAGTAGPFFELYRFQQTPDQALPAAGCTGHGKETVTGSLTCLERGKQSPRREVATWR
jgi:hypothetical protein